jgi:hypothetical protein
MRQVTHLWRRPTSTARNNNNYAEYMGLAAFRCSAYVGWTDARAANFTAGTNEDVYAARTILDNEPPVMVGRRPF